MNKTLSKLFPTFFPPKAEVGALGSVKPVPVAKPFLLIFSADEQMHFAKRLAMIMRSGMPIVQGISLLGSQTHGSGTRYVFHELATHVSMGQSLSSGLKKFEHIFGEFAVNIVKVGETIGTLPENLEHLAEELKKARELKRKVQSALVYPAVIVFATLLITGFLTIYIFPKITPIFASLKSELPLSTKILMALSGFLIDYWLWVFCGGALFVVGVFFLFRVRVARLFWDEFTLRMPLFGPLSRYYNVANISRTFGLLLKSDVKIAQAFEILADSTKNLAYKKALVAGTKEILKGRKISAQFGDNMALFPPIIPQMISVGEQTGNLSGSLLYCAEMYEEELNDFTKNLTTILEPALMIIMGLIVGFVAVSIIMPIYGITQNLTPH